MEKILVDEITPTLLPTLCISYLPLYNMDSWLFLLCVRSWFFRVPYNIYNSYIHKSSLYCTQIDEIGFVIFFFGHLCNWVTRLHTLHWQAVLGKVEHPVATQNYVAFKAESLHRMWLWSTILTLIKKPRTLECFLVWFVLLCFGFVWFLGFFYVIVSLQPYRTFLELDL